MIKRILLLFLFTFSVTFYGQENNGVKTNKKDKQTISHVSAFPNPFRVESKIIFTSNTTQNIHFEVKNILGKSIYKKEIRAIPGKNIINFLKNEIASGMYIYSIQTNNSTISKRLVIR